MPRRLRQKYLGSSPQRMLCLMSRTFPLPPIPLGECYISKLPDEILAEILAYLPPETGLFHKPNYEQCPPIPLICKHWERVYNATLYRELSFVESSAGWQQRRTSNAVKALQQQAELSNHVRNISVQLWRPSEATCRFLAVVIKSCPAIRAVSLHLGWSSKAWPIIKAVGMLHSLEELQLSGYDCGPSLLMVLGYFNQPKLRHLELSRYGLGSLDDPGAAWCPLPILSQDVDKLSNLDKLSDLAHSHTSTMTSLELRDPSASPHCTKILLYWPSRLVRLCLSQLTNSMYGSHYTAEAVRAILDIHRESLHHITIGIIPGKRNEDDPWTLGGIPNFSKFDCLHELHLSAYNVLAEKPSEAATKLAAPLLRFLVMTFCTEDQHSASRTAFAEDQVRWMADFATQKSAAKMGDKLESMFVDFNLEHENFLYRNETETWPWEYLEQAKEEISRCNIVLNYSKPSCTKDEWDHQAVAGRRNAEEEPLAVAVGIESDPGTPE